MLLEIQQSNLYDRNIWSLICNYAPRRVRRATLITNQLYPRDPDNAYARALSEFLATSTTDDSPEYETLEVLKIGIYGHYRAKRLPADRIVGLYALVHDAYTQ